MCRHIVSLFALLMWYNSPSADLEDRRCRNHLKEERECAEMALREYSDKVNSLVAFIREGVWAEDLDVVVG